MHLSGFFFGTLFLYRTAARREIDFLLSGEGGLLLIKVISHRVRFGIDEIDYFY
jgi:hypothetical protein